MNKTVLVTGASRGIGRETALRFAQNGYNVIINYNQSEDSANSLLNEIKSQGGSAIAVKCDVANESEVSEMFSQIKATFSGVDVLVNNAGIAGQKLFTDITSDEWDRMFAVNVKGIFNCTKAALPYMINKKDGRIINISSMWGVTGASCEVHYSASKAAVIGLTKALALEVGPSNITVNCIAPGLIDTEMNGKLNDATIKELVEATPLQRIGTPKDVAEAVLFLASSSASFITGQVLNASGGYVV